MRLALYSANLQTIVPSLLGIRATILVRRFGHRFDQRLSTSVHTQSTAENYYMGSTMGDQCDIKDSKGAASSQGATIDCGEPKEEFPKLTTAEFRVYNRLAEHMDYFVRIYISISIGPELDVQKG